MSVTSMRSLRLSKLLFGAAFVFGVGLSTANAGIPALQVNWWVNGILVNNLLPLGTDNGNGTFGYSGFDVDFFTGVQMNFSLTGDPDPLLSGNMSISNPNMPSVDVVMEVILPIDVALAFTELAGSAAVGLTTNSDGGALDSLTGTPVWRGLLDGIPVGNDASLFFDPFNITISGSGSLGDSDNFGLFGPPVTAGPVSQSIGILIGFKLTQNDSASITSVFNVVPGPGGLAVLACGLFVRRRRRRA